MAVTQNLGWSHISVSTLPLNDYPAQQDSSLTSLLKV
jgi:hypothetical protein